MIYSQELKDRTFKAYEEDVSNGVVRQRELEEKVLMYYRRTTPSLQEYYSRYTPEWEAFYSSEHLPDMAFLPYLKQMRSAFKKRYELTELNIDYYISLLSFPYFKYGRSRYTEFSQTKRNQKQDKLLNGFFQSVTLRTAGFAAIDQGQLTEPGKAVSMVFMLIGGSSGSTAGGMKTVTVVVMLLFLAARARGRSTVCAFKRTIPQKQVLDAMTIAFTLFCLVILGGIFISATSPVGLVDALFEASSALGTVGLTAGATSNLSVAAQVLIIIYMYFGRVGVLTISLGFLAGNRVEERFYYAQTNLLIG